MGLCGSKASKYDVTTAKVQVNSVVLPPAWLGMPSVVTGRHKTLHNTMVQLPNSNNWDEMEFVKVLGRGKFGEVVLTKHTEDSCFYAVKKISKRQIVERKNKESVHNEITHLLRMRHPFIAHLFGYFQDDDNVNLILEYCAGGELYNRMERSVKVRRSEGWSEGKAGAK